MSVRPVRADEVETVAAVLGRAFAGDPFSRWLFGEEPVEPMRRLFRSQLGVLYVGDERAVTVDDLSGAALWREPGRHRFSLWESLRVTPASLRVLGARRARRAGRAFSVVEAQHPKEPHHYLAVLGVDPARQRSGVGRTLIEAGVARAGGVPIYLDTSNPDNVPYYRQHGFEVISEFEIPEGGPAMWGLLRRTGRT